MSEIIDHSRRRLLGTAAMTIAAAEIGMMSSAHARSSRTTSPPQPKPGTRTSFGTLKQIDAGVLNIGYAEDGPNDGPAVILLHGWPYDIHSYVDVTAMLASAGYRVIVPYLRGYGTTRFLSDQTFRNAQQAAVAVDVIKLMDALEIKKAIVAGYDCAIVRDELLSTCRRSVSPRAVRLHICHRKCIAGLSNRCS